MGFTSNASLPNKKYRLEFGRKIVDFESAVKQLGSERSAAKHTGIPRSTYQHLHIATSDGSLCDRLQRLEDSIVEFGEIQFDHLSKKMPKKPIACAMPASLVGASLLTDYHQPI